MRSVLLASVLAFALPAWAFAGEKDHRLDIYWVDVEGGAATLIVTPQGESVLIDTGNPGRRDPDRIVQVAAKAAGLRKLDHVVITHYHVDHFGGAAMLSTLMPIGHLHDNGLFPTLRERPDEAYLQLKSEQRSVISPGDELPLAQTPKFPKLSLTCLAARQQVIKQPVNGRRKESSGKASATIESTANEQCTSSQDKPIDNSDNANSVVLLLEYGPFKFFDAGDLTWNIEKQLACPQVLVPKVDVYQTTHHGLDASGNPLLVQALDPVVAVMNNGATKGCDPGVVATLRGLPGLKSLYQMHRNERPGEDANNTQPELIANAKADCRGNYVKLSVAPEGTSYTITVPATGHEQTYTTRAAK